MQVFFKAIVQARLRLILAVLLTAAVLAPAARAEQGSLKIGVVDFDQVTQKSVSLKKAMSKADQMVLEEQDKMDKKTEELQKLRQELTTGRSVMSESQIQSKEEQGQRLRDEIEDMQVQVNRKIQRIQREIMDPQVDKIMAAVKAIAQRKGLDLVLRSEDTLFHSDSIDITSLVIQELDKGASEAPAADSKPAKED